MRARLETHLCGILIQIGSNTVTDHKMSRISCYSEDTLLSGCYLLGILIQVRGCQVSWTDSQKQMNWKCVQFQLHYDHILVIYISVESCDECWTLLAEVGAG